MSDQKSIKQKKQKDSHADDDLQKESVSSDPPEMYLGALFSVENLPAFKFLDTLKPKRDYSDEKINQLKEKLQGMYVYLHSISDYEKNLAKKCKVAAQEISIQRVEMDKSGNRLFSANSSIGELKRELLKAENEVRLAVERNRRIQEETTEAIAQKTELFNDIEEIRRHKADMLEPQLIASTKELKLDVIQRRHQVENLQKDLEEKEATLEKTTRDKDRLEVEKEKHSVALAKASEIPTKIIKQTEVLRDAISSLVVENVKQTTMGTQLDKEIERLAKKRKELEENKLDQAADYEQRRAEIHEMEKRCDEIFKQHEFAKDQLSAQKGERVRLELAFKKVIFDIKREHDVLLHSIRDKEIKLKINRRLETTVNNILMSAPQTKKQSEDLQRQVEHHKREGRHFRKLIGTLRKDVDSLIFDFLKQEQMEKSELTKCQTQFNHNKRLEEELDELIKFCDDLERQIETLSSERELKSRELIRIREKHRNIKEDSGAKEVAINDAKKRCEEAVSRLRDFATLYDVVKNERNKYMNQIQATLQRAAEMKEKIKILSNEIEILRHEIMNKDRELSKKRQENTAKYALRDSAKNEANKLLALYRERREQIEQHLSKIETLNTLINAAEDDMVFLKNRYEQAVKERNSVGVNLLDRNDELCILYEKLNIQAGIMAKGEESLIEKELEIRELQLTVTELERSIELLKKQRPKVDEYDKELTELQKEIDGVREQIGTLSAEIENPEDPNRCRYLKGVDPTQKDLLERIKNIEEILAEREENLLEKDLVLEEVTTLTLRLQKQTIEGRSESNLVALQLNDLTKRIKHITKAMMARVSELSMQQALAMSIYHEKNEKERLLAEAKIRLSRGEPPTEEIERDFIQAERKRLRRETELLDLATKRNLEGSGFVGVDDENFFVYNNIRTLAEPRPNAYVPDTSGIGELPIPKPYGVHAPFKPSEIGSQLRRFRKPIVKPIQI
ncbi:hypothetical protein HK098_002149 [Nowakowskiella sp. JEL0407]|nr:hypothetical protein HK098_002149 [Nowakowskiella sp. JEL0407]